MMKNMLCAVTCFVVLGTLILTAGSSYGQVLYSQDFDVDDSANWTINAGNGNDLATGNILPMDTNFDIDGDGIVDSTDDIFFDYSTVGIPSAPNSSGGSTRGMKLQSNLFSDAFGGFSVSPTGQSFTGDYKLSYDIWSNYIGNLDINSDPPDGPASGQTNLSYAGILTSGTVSNSPGFDNADSVYFAYTTDGDSGADYRAYSADRDVSYQHPADQPNDSDATYFAGTRNHTGQLYTDNFGGVSAPADQLALFPSQTGSTLPGVAGMAWRAAEIEKIGDTVTWKMDGVLLVSLDISNFTHPTGGNNILFGHADINQGSSTEILAETLLFTLIDNIEVTVSGAVENADFDEDTDVDGNDFLLWQRGFGIDDGTALVGDGDADGNGNVDAADLAVWESQLGTSVGPLSAITAVPEPTSFMLMGLASLGFMRVRRR